MYTAFKNNVTRNLLNLQISSRPYKCIIFSVVDALKIYIIYLKKSYDIILIAMHLEKYFQCMGRAIKATLFFFFLPKITFV